MKGSNVILLLVALSWLLKVSCTFYDFITWGFQYWRPHAMLYTFLMHEQSVQWFVQHVYVCDVYTLLQGIDLGCSEWLNELLLPFYGLEPVFLFWPLTLDINKTFPTTQLPPTGYFLLWGSSSVNTRDGCAAVKFPSDQQQFAKHSDHRQRLESLLNLSCLLFVLTRNWEFLLLNLVVRVKKCGILLLFLLLVCEVITVKSGYGEQIWKNSEAPCISHAHSPDTKTIGGHDVESSPLFHSFSFQLVKHFVGGPDVPTWLFFSEASTSSVA